MVTISDIAAKAGVSRVAVSYALRGRSNISPARREEILRIAKELGYRPHRTARLLMQGRTGIIGVAISSAAMCDWNWRETMPLTWEVIQGVQDELQDHGYDLKLMMPSAEKMEECFERELFAERRVDGVVLFGDTGFAKEIPNIVAHGIKCVSFATFPSKDYAIPTILADPQPGITQIVQAAWDLGHRVAGCIGVRELFNSGGSPRQEAFMEECRQIGIQIRSEHCKLIRDEGQAGQATQELLGSPDRPTVIFYTADHLAVRGQEAIQAAGLQIPRDISVTGVDDAPYLPSYIVPLATVRLPRRERGRLAATTLLQLIEGAGAVPDVLTLKSRFIPRQSLGPCP